MKTICFTWPGIPFRHVVTCRHVRIPVALWPTTPVTVSLMHVTTMPTATRANAGNTLCVYTRRVEQKTQGIAFVDKTNAQENLTIAIKVNVFDIRYVSMVMVLAAMTLTVRVANMSVKNRIVTVI